MNSVDDLIEKIEQYEGDIETLIAVYKEAICREQEFGELKKIVLEKVHTYCLETGQLKGRTDVGSFGITQPKPKKILDEVKWGQALQQKEFLRICVAEVERQTKLIEFEKAECMIEVPVKGTPYIK